VDKVEDEKRSVQTEHVEEEEDGANSNDLNPSEPMNILEHEDLSQLIQTYIRRKAMDKL
jgi:hypothetical protein